MKWLLRIAMLLTSILLLGFSGVPGFGAEETPSLDQQLRAIIKEAERPRDVEKAVTDRLALLRSESTPEEKGQVYYEVTEIYYRLALVKNTAKVIEYAKKALEFPLETQQVTDMYVAWGGALYGIWGGWLYDPSISPPVDIDWDKRNRDFAAMRREVAQLYMSAEKLLLVSNIPRKPLSVPVMEVYNYFGDESSAESIYSRRLNEAQLAVRKKIDATNELVQRRLWLEGELVSMYSHEPYETSELRRLGLALLGEKELVEELVSKAEENISKVGKSVQGSAGTPSK